MSHVAARGEFFPLWPEPPKLELEAGSARGSAISLRETITNTYVQRGDTTAVGF